MTKPLCIYHANCADGMTAAWAVMRALGHDRVDFFPGEYQRLPPPVYDRDVILVDFSYKRHVLRDMTPLAKSILILDHHKSAQEELEGLPTAPQCYAEWRARLEEGDNPSVAALFDMNRSGAGITWDFFHPAPLPRPALVDYVEDRDLWRFALPESREINAAVGSYELSLHQMDMLHSILSGDISCGTRHELVVGGRAILRKNARDLEQILSTTTRRMTIGGVQVEVANLPFSMTSDGANILANRSIVGFAASYADTEKGRVFSLRSVGGYDVSKIAEAYGGGGHAKAAGFTMPLGWEGDAA